MTLKHNAEAGIVQWFLSRVGLSGENPSSTQLAAYSDNCAGRLHASLVITCWWLRAP